MAWHFVTRPILDPKNFISAPESEGGNIKDLQQGKEIADTPTATVFAGKGDHLVDLSEAFRAWTKADNRTWLVWNETRHLLIGHGRAGELLTMEQSSGFREQDKILFTSFDWYPASVEASAIPAGLKSERHVVLHGISGALQIAEAQGDGAIPGVHVEVDETIGDEIFGTHLNAMIKWTEQDGDRTLQWSLGAQDEFDDRKPEPHVMLRTFSPTGRSWTVITSCQHKLTDGTLWSDARWREADGKAQPAAIWILPAELFQVLDPSMKVNGLELKYRTYSVPPNFQEEMADDSGGESIPWQALARPPELWPEVQTPMIDAKPALLRAGVRLEPGDYAGYCQSTDSLFVATSKPRIFEMLDVLLAGGDTSPSLVTISFDAIDEAMASRTDRKTLFHVFSGGKAVLSCQEGVSELVRWLFEPTVGNTDSVIDFRYEGLLHATGKLPGFKLSGSTTVPVGMDSLIQQTETGTAKSSISVKAETSRISPLPGN